MSETPDPTAPLSTEAPPAAPTTVEDKPKRLNQVAAWVAIVAGTLVILAVVFFSGFVLGRHADGGPGHHHGGHHGHHMKFERGFPMGPPMGPPMGFGEGHRWPGPGNFGPGGPGAVPGVPGQPPQPSTPTPPSR